MFTEFYLYAYVNMGLQLMNMVIISIMDFNQPYEIQTLCSQEKMASSFETLIIASLIC